MCYFILQCPKSVWFSYMSLYSKDISHLSIACDFRVIYRLSETIYRNPLIDSAMTFQRIIFFSSRNRNKHVPCQFAPICTSSYRVIYIIFLVQRHMQNRWTYDHVHSKQAFGEWRVASVRTKPPSNGDSIQFACSNWSRPWLFLSDMLTKTHIVCDIRAKIRAVAKIYELAHPVTTSKHSLFNRYYFRGELLACLRGARSRGLLKSFLRACDWLYISCTRHRASRALKLLRKHIS